MNISEQILELATKIEALNEKIELVNGNVQFNVNLFWIIAGIVVAISTISLVYIAKESVKSGIEKGIKETQTIYEDKFAQIKSEYENQKLKISGLIESGSNANGSYVKFEDGTLICSKKIIIEFDYYEGLLTKRILFPATFWGDIVINISLAENLHHNESYKKYVTYSKLTVTGVTITVRNDNSSNEDTEEVSVVAIGRWK